MVGSEHAQSPDVSHLFNEELKGEEKDTDRKNNHPVGFGMTHGDKPNKKEREFGWGS